MRRPKKQKVSQQQLGIKPGDMVEVTRDDGSKEQRKARSEPWQLEHGDWVVGLDGISGGYALDRCVPIATN